MQRTAHDHAEDETPEELRESAYRRGVEHGFQMARDLLAKGAGEPPAFREHARKLGRWRYRLDVPAPADRAEVVPPPWPS